MVRVHQVRGKERGLMIIGAASELRAVATRLLAALEGKPEMSSSAGPEMISEYLDVQELDQGISFHLETISGDQPKKVFGDTELGKTIVFILAIIGFIATVRFVASYAL